ncbi:hypothetical protein E2493_13950 [Sphingomonas parva]|uniref:Right handed beta helix domain-containing protein n=1 Tax=Sphingomonas parva TaxID=2555898 RepID=A0A4Y8ZNT3_9SPHN|nr:right-handed parallel beta-helix repeat-containing protein [Sphingomonas parva]TFI57624.1 hypothetical protein E2493_13950 [Sphingomonas parva]
MIVSRRHVLQAGAAAAPVLLPALAVAAELDRLTPEMFGAKGDGVANDSAAFGRLAAAVNARGGGTIVFGAGRTYLVGAQIPAIAPGAQYAFAPVELLAFEKCTRPLVLRGNGARIKCAPNLRYGTFDRAGRPTRNSMPYVGAGELATPYRHMIRIERCSGPIEVSDLELDGSLGALQIGGEYGDTGRQIPAIGLALFDNPGSESIRNVYTHHHGQDGLYIDGVVDGPATARRITNVRSEYNGRQGCSIVGGRGYVFEDCRFNHTGKSAVVSAPGAGVDIEAEAKINRDFRFINCEFANNAGCGLVADSGDSEGAVFERCTFIGSSNWAVWPKKPRFRFHDCTIVGQVVQCHGDPDLSRATQFHNCRFRDDPKLSPTGKLWASGGANACADLGANSTNIAFIGCDFALTHELVLPWSWHALYRDCRMSQRSKQQAYPKGTYSGRNVINANVDLYGTKFLGPTILNGTEVPRS